MATKQVMHGCRNCGRPTAHLEQQPPHVLHAVITLMTFGLWLVPWILITAVGMGAPQCSECGKKRGTLGLW